MSAIWRADEIHRRAAARMPQFQQLTRKWLVFSTGALMFNYMKKSDVWHGM
jgi:hypothetical protein